MDDGQTGMQLDDDCAQAAESMLLSEGSVKQTPTVAKEGKTAYKDWGCWGCSV